MAYYSIGEVPTPTLFGLLNYCAGDSVLISLDQAFAQMEWSGGQTTQQIYADDTDNPVSVMVTSAEGCVATIQLPPIIENISPISAFTTQNECQYDELNFANTSANSINYSWDFGDGSAQTSIQSPNHLYNQEGIYTVTLIAFTSENCSDTTTQTITVYAIPVANYSVQSVCQGIGSAFVDNSTLNSSTSENIVSWNWAFGDGLFESGTGVTHAYAIESVYSSGLVVTTSNGCMDSVSVPVTVWPLPQVNFSSTAVCQGFSTQFQDFSTISTANSSNTLSTWSWNFGDGGIASTQNPIHSYTTSGGLTANLTVTSNNGCLGQASLPVTVYPIPTVQFSGTSLSGCSPICANLISTSSVASGNMDNYIWSLNTGETSTAGPSAQFCLFNTTGATIFYDATLIVTTDFGCKDTAFASNYIAVFHNPIADFIANPQVTDMLNTTINLTNSSIYADSYFWSFGDGGTSSEINPSVTYDAIAQNYTVDLVAFTVEGCIDTTQLVVTVNEVLVYYVPNGFTPDGDEFNNVFQPVFTSGFDPFNFNLLIFNRWGEVIFESNNHEVGWDGTYHGESVKEGTYTWKIRFKSNRNDAFTDAVGHVSLIR